MHGVIELTIVLTTSEKDTEVHVIYVDEESARKVVNDYVDGKLGRTTVQGKSYSFRHEKVMGMTLAYDRTDVKFVTEEWLLK
jgi:hypothetical protein